MVVSGKFFKKSFDSLYEDFCKNSPLMKKNKRCAATVETILTTSQELEVQPHTLELIHYHNLSPFYSLPHTLQPPPPSYPSTHTHVCLN